MPLLKPETRRHLLEADRQWLPKLIIRISTTASALLAIAAFAGSIVMLKDDPSVGYEVMILTFLILSVLHNIASVSYTLSRARPPPDPLDFIFDITLAVLYFPYLPVLIVGAYWYGEPPNSGFGYCNPKLSDDCEAGVYKYWVGVLQIVGFLLSLIAGCLTLTTSVWACTDLHKQHKRCLAAIKDIHQQNMRRRAALKDVELQDVAPVQGLTSPYLPSEGIAAPHDGSETTLVGITTFDETPVKHT